MENKGYGWHLKVINYKEGIKVGASLEMSFNPKNEILEMSFNLNHSKLDRPI